MNFVNEILSEEFSPTASPPILCRQKAFSDTIGYTCNYPENRMNEEVDIDENIFRSIPINSFKSSNNVHRRSHSETNINLKELNLKRINTF